MNCSAKAIANYFLRAHPKQISHLKLQKLVYFSHGWHLGIFDKSLVTDEFVEAWKHGPVFPSLYHEFKSFRSKNINKLATEVDEETGRAIYYPVIREDDKLKKNLLDAIWDTYGDFTAIELRNLTHKEGTPWSETCNTYPGVYNATINNDIIKTHFKKKLEASEI